MEEGWEQQAVCVLSPLLHKACWTSFWQVSDFLESQIFGMCQITLTLEV